MIGAHAVYRDEELTDKELLLYLYTALFWREIHGKVKLYTNREIMQQLYEKNILSAWDEVCVRDMCPEIPHPIIRIEDIECKDEMTILCRILADFPEFRFALKNFGVYEQFFDKRRV